MDEKIAILTDTNSGINPDQAAQYGIHLVSMPVIIDDETYFENESIFQDEFFQRLREGACVSTSQPAPGVLMDCWEGLLERYDEIIYLPMSSGLSGSCQTAAMLAEEYDGSVHVVDNHRISVTLRQSVLEAKYLADQGKTAQEIVAYLEQDGLEASIYVAVNTLEYLKKKRPRYRCGCRRWDHSEHQTCSSNPGRQAGCLQKSAWYASGHADDD